MTKKTETDRLALQRAIQQSTLDGKTRTLPEAIAQTNAPQAIEQTKAKAIATLGPIEWHNQHSVYWEKTYEFGLIVVGKVKKGAIAFVTAGTYDEEGHWHDESAPLLYHALADYDRQEAIEDAAEAEDISDDTRGILLKFLEDAKKGVNLVTP